MFWVLLSNRAACAQPTTVVYPPYILCSQQQENAFLAFAKFINIFVITCVTMNSELYHFRMYILFLKKKIQTLEENVSMLTSHFQWSNPACLSWSFTSWKWSHFHLLRKALKLVSFSKRGQGDAGKRAGQTEVYGVLSYTTNIIWGWWTIRTWAFFPHWV